MCGKGSNTTTSTSQAPAWLQSNLQKVYNQAQNITSQPLQQYNGSVIAGFTPQQQSAFDTINNAQGISLPYINSAAQMVGQSSGIDPNSIQNYLNPYTQNVVNSTQAQINQNDAIQQQQLLGNSIKSGASPFGGDRAGVASAALAGQQALANNQTIAGLYSNGYNQATQTALNNAYLGQQGASQIANLGNLAQNNTLQGANAQLQAGSLQQQLGQEQLNIPYEQFIQQQAYPYQQLGVLENATGLAGGLAGGTTSQTGTSPSTLSQVAGLGLAGLGLFAKDGGIIADYDAGGLVPDLSQSYINSNQPTQFNQYKANLPQIQHIQQQSPNYSGIADAFKGVKNLKNGTENTNPDDNDSSGGGLLSSLGTFGDDAMQSISDIGDSFLKKGGIAAYADGSAVTMDDLPPVNQDESPTDYYGMDQAAANVDYNPEDAVKGVGQAIGIQNAMRAGIDQQQTPAQQILSVFEPDGTDPAEVQTSAQAAMAGTHGDFEPQKDPNPIFDKSSGSHVVKFPSNNDKIDLGLPVIKDDTESKKWSPLLAAGLAMMSGTSPFPFVNIGKGGIEGLKQYEENQAVDRANRQEQAKEAEAQFNLTREQQAQQESARHNLASEEYQQGELGLKKQQLEQGKAEITKDAWGNPIAIVNKVTGDVTPLDLSSFSTGTQNFDRIRQLSDTIGINPQPLNPKNKADQSKAANIISSTQDNVGAANDGILSLNRIKELIPQVDQGKMSEYSRNIQKLLGEGSTPEDAIAKVIPSGTTERAAYEELTKLEGNAALQNEIANGIKGRALGINMVQLGQKLFASPEMAKDAQMNIVNKSLYGAQMAKNANEIVPMFEGASPGTLSQVKQRYYDDSVSKGFAIPSSDYVSGKYKQSDYKNPQTQPQALIGRSDIPPPSNRIVGQKYNTPKGMLTWTGTGWVQ